MSDFKSKRLGIIGLGNQATEHIRVNHLLEKGKIVAAYDPFITSCVDPTIQLTSSLSELLDLALDGIILAIPHHAYLETLKQIWAIHPNMPIGKEKPLGRSIAEANAILGMATAGGAPLHVFIQRRYHPSYEKLKELMQSVASKPHAMHFEINLGFDRKARQQQVKSWRDSRKQAGGGALVDLGYHMIDLAMHLIGDFELVSSRLYEDGKLLQGDAVDDSAHLVGIADNTWLTIDSRVFSSEHGSNEVYEKKEQVIIHYDNFKWVANRESIYCIEYDGQHEQAPVLIHQNDKSWQSAMKKQLEQFCLTIHHKTPVSQDIVWDQQPVQSIIEAGYQFMSVWNSDASLE